LGTEPRESKVDSRSPGPLNYKPERTVDIVWYYFSKPKLISSLLDLRLILSEISWILLDQVHIYQPKIQLTLLNTQF